MSRFKLFNLIDQLFISICIFLVVYSWVNFYIRDLWTTFILSLVFSFAIIFVIFYYLDRHKTKKINTKKKADEIAKYHLAFRLMSRSQKLELLTSTLSDKPSISLNNDNLTYMTNNKKHLILLATHLEKLTQNDLINLLEGLSNKDIDIIEIICNTCTIINTKLFKDKDIVIIDRDRLYRDYFEASNIYPDISLIDNSITKFNWREFLLNLFKPNKSKSYFLAGFILLFSSIILPYHIYYRVVGTVLMIFALACKLLPKFKKRSYKS